MDKPLLLPLSQLQTGDVLAFRGNGFWSRLIRLRTKSRITHVGVVFVTAVGELRFEQCIEAKEGRGVRQVVLEDYLAKWQRVDVYRPQGVHDGAVNWLLRQGQQGYASVWQFVWSWGWLSSWLRRCFGAGLDLDVDRAHCSELVSRFLLRCGYELPDEPPAMSPGDVVDLPLTHLGRVR